MKCFVWRRINLAAGVIAMATPISQFSAATAQANGSGYLEVCAESLPAEAVSGTMTFTIVGKKDEFHAPIGACTAPISMDAGVATVIEAEAPELKLSRVQAYSLGETGAVSRLVTGNLPRRSAAVRVVSGDVSTQTVVIFTHSPQ